MKSIEDLRAQFNRAWETNQRDRARGYLEELVTAACAPAQREAVIMHLAYWSKYNDGFDQLLDEIIAAQRQTLSKNQKTEAEQAAAAERETKEHKQRLERLRLAAEIEALEREWNQLAMRQIVELQNQVAQQTARADALERDLFCQLDALTAKGGIE